MNTPFIYLRGLRHAEHTVFGVTNGQKYYRDSQFNKDMAYSSGQQVKRSIIEALDMPFAAITFNWEIDKKGKAGMKEPHSPCDPTFVDQLVGGYMKAKSDSYTVKRRSPLSVSAMRPLHPLLGGLERETEPVVFDRSSRPNDHKVVVSRLDEKGDRVTIPEDELEDWLVSNNRNLGPKYYNGNGQTRASGLFVYDVAIDLRTLFCVSTNKLEPELFLEIEEKLRAGGWKDGKNIFGNCLICPKEKRAEIIPALANAIINWRITSNQSRTFSLMETVALAISDNANQIAYAIRGDLREDSDRLQAVPKIDEKVKADLFVTPIASSYIIGSVGSSDALEKAEQKLIDLMLAFDYENQLINA
ncbi:MAG: CRISPR-associated protein Cas7 [Bacteroidales bacterium]|nr:CRISPR-associated protein Cas7 [Bacteroidales bacterium]